MRVSGFGLQQTEVFARDCRYVSCEACCLVRVGAGKSDSRHEADSPFHTIKVSRVLDASTVLMMGMNKCVNEAHHHDSVLEASQEHLGDQVMEKMVSPWKHSSLSPKRSKHIIQKRAFVVVGERVGLIRASNATHFVHNPQCEIFEPCKARCRGCEERQQ